MKPINAKKEVIRKLLSDHPAITHGQLVLRTGWAPNTVSKYMAAIRAEWDASEGTE